MREFEVSDSHELDTLLELIPAEHLANTHICGGYPAFVAGITNKFRDIDLYFKDKKTYKAVNKILEGKTKKVLDGPYASTFRYNKCLIQCIFCITGEVTNILDSFDINVCQVAITRNNDCWVGQANPLAFGKLRLANVKNPIRTAARLGKYHERMVRRRPYDYTGLMVGVFCEWEDYNAKRKDKLFKELVGYAENLIRD